MAICKFFVQGHCKYGSSCRFEHPVGGNAGYAYSAQRQLFGGGGGGRGGGGGGGRSQQNPNQYKWQASDYSQRQGQPQATQQMSTNDVINTLISEVTEWESNNMWPFSCVGFEKDSPCIPEFTDHSPEELRTAAYEAMQSGNIQPYIQLAETLVNEYKQKRSQVKNMTMTLKQKLISMIEDYRLNKNKSGSSSSNSSSLFSNSKSAFGGTSFGSSSSSSSLGSTGSANAFGSSGNSPLSAAGTSSAFGSSGASPLGTSSIFGTTGSSSTFGSTGSSSTFGATGLSSTFGTKSTSPLGATAASSAFGTQPFGASNIQTQSGSQATFGTSAFPAGTLGSTSAAFSGTQTGPSPLAFGAGQNQASSSFGHEASNFTSGGVPTVAQSGFGASPFTSQTQSTGLFGKPAPAPAANAFGSFTAQPSASGFSTVGPSPSAFPSGGASPHAFPPTTASSISDSQKYTSLDHLTKEELEAFQAPTFTLGKIPTRPPPKELVF
ncbi:nucleoporin NUP42-like isoform X2 [Mytilus edulis]|uniref:nucleoporin NUP42-like isoform X2 n=1 Tax=Mytilus edulis TaxID=6550 RepID=UPI0039F05A23